MSRDPDFLAPRPTREPVPARIRFSKAADVQAYLDGTHQQLQEAKLAQIVQEVEFETAVEDVKQQRAEAKQHAKQRASDWDQLDKLDR